MIEKILQKYWSKKSSLEEKKELLEILENQQFVSEKIIQTWSKDEDHLTIHKELSRKVLKKIHHQINETQKTETHYLPTSSFLKFSIVASLVLFCVFGLLYKKNIDSTSTLVHTNLDTISNETDDKLMNIRLKDESKITLYPKSKIVYDHNYNQKNRKISLVGKAKFKVFKNKELPFSVSTQSFTTTALGTEFIVTENIKNKQATVQLLEGKVRIDSKKKEAFESIYLNAGDNFRLDLLSNQVQIMNQKKSKSKPTSSKKFTEKKELITLSDFSENEKIIEKANEIIFDKTPLKDVFHTLEQTFQTKIYPTNIPDELTFTGRVNSTEDITRIMEIICELNDLQHHIIDNQIYIEK